MIEGVGISPDGKQVAYTSENYLWVVSIQGGDSRSLFRCGCIYLNPESWSPDSMLIAYSGNCQDPMLEGEQPRRSLCIYDMSTGEVFDLQSSVKMRTAWSPDGRYLAVTGLEPDAEPCYTRDYSTEDLAVITRHRQFILSICRRVKIASWFLVCFQPGRRTARCWLFLIMKAGPTMSGRSASPAMSSARSPQMVRRRRLVCSGLRRGDPHRQCVNGIPARLHTFPVRIEKQ